MRINKLILEVFLSLFFRFRKNLSALIGVALVNLIKMAWEKHCNHLVKYTIFGEIFGGGGGILLTFTVIYFCLFFVGYSLSADCIGILFDRFSFQGKYMKVDDFIACLTRVKIVTGKFIKHS